jgi:hypothetical protein
LALLTGAGCAREVTEDDCKAVAAHLHAIWTSEAKFPAAGGPAAEKAMGVVRSEGGELEASFNQQCRKDLLGKPRASGEISCLMHAKTIAEVRTCAEF